MVDSCIIAAVRAVPISVPPSPVICGGRLTGTHTAQVFTDGTAAGERIPDGRQCSWLISVPHGERVELRFTQIAMKRSDWGSCLDVVFVYDGTPPFAPRMGWHCGPNIPPVQVSSSHSIYVASITLGAKGASGSQSMGFVATYRIASSGA